MAARIDMTAPAKARGETELLALLVGQMALLALTLDMMLPALPDIAAAHGVADGRLVQAVVTAYLAGLALGHLAPGPLSDRVGRKPVLLGGLAVAGIGGAAVLTAPSHEVLLAGRFLQGVGLAAPRVMVMAILRDRYVGAEMSRALSLVIGTFLLVPALAPALGQGLLHVSSWRGLFVVLLAATIAMGAWAWLRLPETRKSGRPTTLGETCMALARRPKSLVLMVAVGIMFGCVLSFVASAEALFRGHYGLGETFALAFAVVTVGQIAAFQVNARVVRRFGTAATCAFGLGGFALLAVAMAVGCAFGTPPVEVMVAYLACSWFFFGHALPNLNAIAMEPLGEFAGAASSLLGFATFAVGGLVAAVVGPAIEADVTMMPVTFLASAMVVSGVFLAARRA